MKNVFLIFVSSSLINNLVLLHFCGLCPLMRAGKNIEIAQIFSGITTCVIVISSIWIWIFTKIILVPLQMIYLRYTICVLIIATMVQLVEIIMKKVNPLIYQSLGIFFPLITTNCMILNTLLLSIDLKCNFLETIFYVLGTSLGFSLVIILFSSIQERLTLANIPVPFQGISIRLITLGLISLAFMGFQGMINF
ncbi:electron transport complex protein RnfA [Candidatus Ishikawella capsulata]|nr:Rnf-Nqr domain containing protein [Candidatus Ishikawaella capsulata]